MPLQVNTLAAAETAPERNAAAAVFYVPGYRPDLARYRGRPVPEAPEFRRQLPADYAGETTMIARIASVTVLRDRSASVRSAMPFASAASRRVSLSRS